MAEISQKIICCPKGLHYYDANRYSECPYCKDGGVFSPTRPGSGFDIGPTDPGPGIGPTGGFPPTSGPGEGQSLKQTGNFPPTKKPPEDNIRRAVGMGKTQILTGDGIKTENEAFSPVVGWLVAVTGPCRGSDFRIRSGYNYIGRERGDIRIAKDAAVSSERDSVIAYDFKTKRFYIAHEQGKNILLVNDTPVISGQVELKNHDRITIGSTVLILIALCGEKFSWEDNM